MALGCLTSPNSSLPFFRLMSTPKPYYPNREVFGPEVQSILSPPPPRYALAPQGQRDVGPRMPTRLLSEHRTSSANSLSDFSSSELDIILEDDEATVEPPAAAPRPRCASDTAAN